MEYERAPQKNFAKAVIILILKLLNCFTILLIGINLYLFFIHFISYCVNENVNLRFDGK